MFSRRTFGVLCGCVSFVMQTSSLWATDFQGIGAVPGVGENAIAEVVSDDGAFVGVRDNQKGFRSSLWERESGVFNQVSVNLVEQLWADIGADIPGGGAADFFSPSGISNDGSILVGPYIAFLGFSSANRGWYATSDELLSARDFGINSSPVYFEAPNRTAVFDVAGTSNDWTMVGEGFRNAAGANNVAYRSVNGGPAEPLPLPAGEPQSAEYGAVAISRDRTAILGSGGSGGIIVWTQAGAGFQANYIGQQGTPIDIAMTSQGPVVLGRALSVDPFRWSQTTGSQLLGSLPGGIGKPVAKAMSGDGSRIVGTQQTSSGSNATLWTPSGQVRALKDVLVNDYGMGQELQGWTLSTANDISESGRTIVGSGINPQGKPESWITSLDIIVGLRWGEPVPLRTVWKTDATTQQIVGVIEAGESPAANVSPAFKAEVIQGVRDTFAAVGIEGVRFTDVPTANVDIEVYFGNIEDFPAGFNKNGDVLPRLGRAFENGHDPQNRTREAKVFVSVPPGDAEQVFETLAHEVAHTFGVEHVASPKAEVHDIMEQGVWDSNLESFTNEPLTFVCGDRELPLTHNPVYYMKRYVDDVPADKLTGFAAGDYDELGGGIPGCEPDDLLIDVVSLRQNMLLYDVEVIGGDSDGDDSAGASVIARFPTIMLEDLLTRSFEVGHNGVFQILASSELAAIPDIVLATGNPWSLNNKLFRLHSDRTRLYVQQIQESEGSYGTLAEIDVRLSSVPEPSSVILMLLCVALSFWVRLTRYQSLLRSSRHLLSEHMVRSRD